MTKADIVESVYAHMKLSKKEATDVVELLIETLKSTMERGEKVKIAGFGNFHIKDKAQRTGRNPQTGKEIAIAARRVLSFRPSQLLKTALNAPPPSLAALPKTAPKAAPR